MQERVREVQRMNNHLTRILSEILYIILYIYILYIYIGAGAGGAADEQPADAHRDPL